MDRLQNLQITDDILKGYVLDFKTYSSNEALYFIKFQSVSNKIIYILVPSCLVNRLKSSLNQSLRQIATLRIRRYTVHNTHRYMCHSLVGA